MKNPARKTAPAGSRYREIFTRYSENPILTAEDWPYPVNTVFNPAATTYKGETLLLARVEERTGLSHLTKAISKNGVNGWRIDEAPTLDRDVTRKEELWGLEDPRITYLAEIGQYAVVYTAYSGCGPVVSMALTKDFVHFERLGMMMPPEDKDAAMFPRKIGGKWYLMHRPIDRSAHIWISASPDMLHWGEHTISVNARMGAWWDANKVGMSPPPIETKDGWLLLYHGVRQTASGSIYRQGFALLDLENPARVLRRSDDWVFGPRELYEREGDVDDVVFPCGWIVDEDTCDIRLYYGGADSCICLATANLNEVLDYVKHCPRVVEEENANCL